MSARAASADADAIDPNADSWAAALLRYLAPRLGLALMTCLFNPHPRQKSLFREKPGVNPSVAVTGCTCWIRLPSFSLMHSSQ